MSGTSMAAPIVSGILALLIHKRQVEDAPYLAMLSGHDRELAYFILLRAMTLDVGVVGTDNTYGVGFCTLNQKLLTTLRLKQGSNIMYVDNVAKTLPAPLMYYQAPTEKVGMTPIRDPFEAAGGTVTYDALTKDIIIQI
jgi:subtilisin family serine protease